MWTQLKSGSIFSKQGKVISTKAFLKTYIQMNVECGVDIDNLHHLLYIIKFLSATSKHSHFEL